MGLFYTLYQVLSGRNALECTIRESVDIFQLESLKNVSIASQFIFYLTSKIKCECAFHTQPSEVNLHILHVAYQ